MQSMVYFSPCPDYGQGHIDEAFRSLLIETDALSWVEAGMKIAVKVNLVAPMKPESAGVTHPALVRALCALLIERGAEVTVGDSPGGPFTAAWLSQVYRTSGMHAVEEVGAKLNDDFSIEEVPFEAGREIRRISVAAWLLRADAVINFAKLKTHGMMGYSGAVKNMFGIIPGTMKLEYHFTHADEGRFANMLLDLNEFLPCRLSLIDAVVGMEGNGPTAGSPRPVGVLLASPSPHALDLAALSLIGLSGDEVPTVKNAIEHGLLDKEQAPPEGLSAFRVDNYQLITERHSLQFANQLPGILGKWLGKFAKKALASRPQPEKDSCIGCRKCAEVCPAKAIVMKDKRPRIDRGLCIRCFCCQEFCPVGAMKVKRTALAKLLTHQKRK